MYSCVFELSFPFRFSNKNPVYVCRLPRTCHIPRPLRRPRYIILMLFGVVNKLRSYISPNYRPRTEPRGWRTEHLAGVASSSCCCFVRLCCFSFRSLGGLRWYFFGGRGRFRLSFVRSLAIGRRQFLATYSRTTGKNHLTFRNLASYI